jgi:hypothetical protein
VQLRVQVDQALVREARVQVVQVLVLVLEVLPQDDQEHKAGPHRLTPSSA